MENPIVDEDIEDPVLTRGLMSSGLSFAVSVVFHLIILLMLAFAFRATYGDGTITLELNTSDNAAMFIQEEALIEFNSDDDALEAEEMLEEVEFENKEVESEIDEVFDFSELEDFIVDGNFANEQTGNESGGKEGEKQEGARSGFFGIDPVGDKIVYIIDMSPSMDNGKYERRYDRAVKEVLSSVDQLRPDQQFFVFLFCFRSYAMNLEGPMTFVHPTPENKKRLRRWLRTTTLESGTDPREALVSALAMKPTCCFLLSDGEFNGRVYGTGKYGRGASAIALSKKHNKNNCPINTVGLEDEGNQRAMTQIAEDSGGVYRFVPANK